jgi:hypothetical protein
MTFPFEAPYSEVLANLDRFAAVVIGSLKSDFLILPKGPGFVEFAAFEDAYERLKKATLGFKQFDSKSVLAAARELPICLVVLRSMLGFTPSEWAHVTSAAGGIVVTQSYARTLDRSIRINPLRFLRSDGASATRLHAMVETACKLLSEGAPVTPAEQLHRLAKVDTRPGGPWMPSLAATGVSYAMLLYERFLGRPFAGHRDSVSEMIGDIVESEVEGVLTSAGISFRKTKRAEKVPGFDQAPDFIVPSAENPKVVIEAKLTEDDGTARDKVTRIQHLAEMAARDLPSDQRRYEVVACIAGRGFKQRPADMKKLLVSTQGKVFTPVTFGKLVDHTSLRDFRTRITADVPPRL